MHLNGFPHTNTVMTRSSRSYNRDRDDRDRRPPVRSGSYDPVISVTVMPTLPHPRHPHRYSSLVSAFRSVPHIPEPPVGSRHTQRPELENELAAVAAHRGKSQCQGPNGGAE